MFKVMIRCGFDTLTGLTALDERRRLKLSDSSTLRHDGQTFKTGSVEVSEGFARAHFGGNDTFLFAAVPLSVLTPADVKELPGDRIEFRDDIPDDRIRELFALAKANDWEIY